MKTRKHIMIVVVLIVLFATVSSSSAKPQKHGRGRKAVVRNSYRSRQACPHRREARPRHRRKVFLRPYRQNRIAVSLPWLRVVFAVPRTRVVAAAPPKVIEPAEITVWIANDNGSLTAVTLTRRLPGYTGPLGEYYPTMPTEEQLKILYGLTPQNASHLYPRVD